MTYHNSDARTAEVLECGTLGKICICEEQEIIATGKWGTTLNYGIFYQERDYF